MSTRTVVAIGCSTDADYNFLLPLTCLFWREHIGHQPFALLVGTEAEWRGNPRLTVALDALYEFSIPKKWLGHLIGADSESSYADAQLAQNARQHAAAAAIADEDWIMPADADLWPLRREAYHYHVGTSLWRAVVAPYANGDHFIGKSHFLKAVAEGRRSQTIPTCHVVMRAKDWREVYGLGALSDGDGDVTGAVRRTLDAWFKRFPRDTFNEWMSDQDILTAKLCDQPWFPDGAPPFEGGAVTVGAGGVLMVTRPGHPPIDRLCRSVLGPWMEDFNLSRWTDSHVFKNPTAPEHWDKLLPIVEAVLPQKYWAWAMNYHKAYVEASK